MVAKYRNSSDQDRVDNYILKSKRKISRENINFWV